MGGRGKQEARNFKEGGREGGRGREGERGGGREGGRGENWGVEQDNAKVRLLTMSTSDYAYSDTATWRTL